MSDTFYKLVQLSSRLGLPVVMYDSHTDTTGVVMDIDVFEEKFSLDEAEEIEYSENLLEELEEEDDDDEPTEEEAFSVEDQLNRNIALFKAQHEEEELEKRAHLLEEELETYPLPDPFAEDMSHSSEWHETPQFPDFNFTSHEPAYVSALREETLEWEVPTYEPLNKNFLEDSDDEDDDEPIFFEEPV